LNLDNKDLSKKIGNNSKKKVRDKTYDSYNTKL